MGMATIASYDSTAPPPTPTSETDSSTVYYSSTNSTRYYYVSNSTYSTIARRSEEDEEEARKKAHAEACRKRKMSYLWRELHGLRRLRFRVVAPNVRFVPSWSSRRWRSLT